MVDATGRKQVPAQAAEAVSYYFNNLGIFKSGTMKGPSWWYILTDDDDINYDEWNKWK